MIPFRKSLAFRLLLISFILLALPLLVDSFVIVQNSYHDAIKDAKGYLIEVASSREIPLSEIQPAKLPSLLLIETYLKLAEHFPEEPNKEMNEKLKDLARAGEFYGVFLLKKTKDDHYIVVSASDSSYENKDLTDFVDVMNIYSPENKEKGYFNFLSYDNASFQPYFLVGRVIYSSTGEVLGLLIISANITEKLEQLLTTDTTNYPVNFALLLPNTVVFAASDPTLQFQYFAPLDPHFRKFFIQEELFAKQLLPKDPLPMTSLGYPFVSFTWKGENQVAYFRKLSTSTISLLAYASEESIFIQPLFNFLDIYAIYLLILVIGGSIAYFLTKRLASPMFQLGHVMEEIQKGHLESRYQTDPLGYEINTVGLIFNEMIETLLQKQMIVQQERVESEIYSQELRIGQQVQRSLLVEKMPEYPGVELAHAYLPAKEVGGDFFDVFIKTRGNEQILALAIADASGKGVRACFYSLGVRSMLRTYAKEFDDVGKVMSKTNELFCLDTGDTGMFITVLMGFYNYLTNELSYYSCGHNPAVLRKSNGDVLFLNHLGMAMGLEPKLEAQARKIKLEKEDLIVFYTDGITEAHDAHFHMYTEERLSHFLKTQGQSSANEVVEKLIEDVRMFVGSTPQHDDITLLVMKVL